MAFTLNSRQHQLNSFDSYFSLTDRERRFLDKSWAKPFAEDIFPAINEERFSVLYSDNEAGRPNHPVNIIVGALLIKEMFNETDEELLEHIMFDTRYQYALHTTSFPEQPFSDRTFSRFRERLYHYEAATGRDLMKEEIEELSEHIRKMMGINSSMKRMDSMMVSSSCKKMARLELIYTCVVNMVKVVNATGERLEILPNLERYLEAGRKNDVIYRSKGNQIQESLEEVIKDAVQLLALCSDAYAGFEEYKLLHRLVNEQTINNDGKIEVKDGKDISSDSLQNPSDPDATYRKKAGKGHVGYSGNFVETFDENGAIITSIGYEQNIHSDSKFCQEVIEDLGPQDEETTLIADGAYGGVNNVKAAEANNIELVATNFSGKAPDAVQADFEINKETNTIDSCPAGEVPIKTSYYEGSETYRANFNRDKCAQCPFNTHCGVKFQQKTAVVMITAKTVDRAKMCKKLSTEEYQKLANKRNGVEGIPSILRRKYHVDHIPVRGYVRSKLWFTLKIGAINVMRLIKKGAELPVSLVISIQRLFQRAIFETKWNFSGTKKITLVFLTP